MPRDGDIIAIFGAPGSGKTTLLARALARDVKNGCQALVHDPTGDISTYLVQRFGMADQPGLFGTHYSHVVRCRTGQSAVRELRSGRPVVCLYSDVATEFHAVGKIFLSLCAPMVRGRVYATDEARYVYLNTTQELESTSAYMMEQARNRGSRLYLAGKLPQRVHTDARSNSAEVCVLHADSERFVDGCQDFGDRKLFAPALKLEQLTYLYRPRYRADSTKALAVRHVLHDPIPWRAFGV